MANPFFYVARSVLLWAAGSSACKNLVSKLPVTKPVVKRFISGETVDDALSVVAELKAKGIRTTVDFLGEDTTDVSQAYATRDAYIELLEQAAKAGLSDSIEVSIKLTALGLGLPKGDEIAYSIAEAIVAAAAAAGTTATVDMEDHTATDQTLAVVDRLREKYPQTGTVLQAMLFRTIDDAEKYSGKLSRIRLCKGAYKEPAAVAHQAKEEVDAAYIKALQVLINGDGRPMVASHDPKIIEIAKELTEAAGLDKGAFEFQMLYGIRTDEQAKLAGEGYNVTVYVPYGTDWWGYFVRRLAERPANLTFFLRALIGK
ncbi:MAG: proline dehydrogenase family protein [Propionibacteriaceae bacterium]|jgi:proline dehydrogenase|nr:proline dehydrogenase family protein [Propionibacteriaceae bacterium]